MTEDETHTKDGTVDIRKKPANKQKTGRWKACSFILVTECCERLAYYGMSSNLENFLKDKFNMGNATAAKQVSNWSGTCYATPLVGAFLADAYMGRYWTIASFSMIYVLGMTLLTLSVSIPSLKPKCDNDICPPKTSQIAVCFLALYMIALATGGIKPCVSSFGADQFDDTDEQEKRRKSSFFNWFYLSINVGALIGTSVLVRIQTDVGYAWGLGSAAVAMAFAVGFFFCGNRFYRLQLPGGSPFTRILQVVVAAFRKLHVEIPADKSLLHETADGESTIQGSRKLEHTENLKFFDKAAVRTENDHAERYLSPWRLCTVTQVEELKAVIRILPVWASGIILAAVYCNINTLFIIQGNAMDKHLGPHFEIAPASMALFDTISVIIFAIIYDQVIVPLARKFTGRERGFTPLQRIGIGLVVATLGMLAAALLEFIRLDIVRKNNYYDLKTTPISIFWQVPQLVISGCSEIFTSIGQLEFFYDQAPDAMRSLCSAFALCTIALGYYLSALLVTVANKFTKHNGSPGWIPEENINRGHLDYFFWLLSTLSVLNFIVYLWIAKKYNYKKTAGYAR